jgi:hypothetical protein
MADLGHGAILVGGKVLNAEEWAQRFKARVIERAGLTPEQHGCADAECDAAMEDGTWVDDIPEDSADEALSYWDNDGDGSEQSSEGGES